MVVRTGAIEGDVVDFTVAIPCYSAHGVVLGVRHVACHAAVQYLTASFQPAPFFFEVDADDASDVGIVKQVVMC